jgi:6-phosphogluconolactonase (cycloisomerase 2 family)
VTSEFNAGQKNLRAIRPDGTVVSTVWAGGEAPVRIEVNAAGDRLALADYEGSVAVFALSKTGSIGRLLNRYASDSSTSRIHSAVFGPAVSNLLYVTDLGDDKVFVFDLGSSRNELRLIQTLAMPEGSGPRQIVFAGKVAYVASELDAHIDVLRVGPKGLLEAVSRVPIEPVGATAELVLDPSGRWLIALMRTPDACVVFSVKGESLTPHSTHGCGRAPRFATFGSPVAGQLDTPTISKGGSAGGSAGSIKQHAEMTLWVAAQKSDEVLALRFDSTTGTLGAEVLVGSANGAAGLVVER